MSIGACEESVTCCYCKSFSGAKSTKSLKGLCSSSCLNLHLPRRIPSYQEKLKERERELRKRKEREEQEMDRVRAKARRKDAVTSYQALLTEKIKDPEVNSNFPHSVSLLRCLCHLFR